MKYKKLNERAITPTRGSDKAAGYDLYACLDSPVLIKPHTTEKIGVGIAIELPEHTFGGIFARSGIATNEGLRPANCVGVVDEDYRGEITVAVHNDSDESRVVSDRERIAQLVILPYVSVSLEEVDDLSTTERGSNGFNSTGKY